MIYQKSSANMHTFLRFLQIFPKKVGKNFRKNGWCLENYTDYKVIIKIIEKQKHIKHHP